MNKTIIPMPAGNVGDSELDQLLGERRAFSRIADSCSAADAECLRRMREERLYLTKGVNWEQFCTRYLDISKTEANRIIQRFEEFGQAYFDVSRLVRISPESYRAIAHAVKDKTIDFNGETIALIPENTQRVTAAVHALRQAAAPKPAERAIQAAPQKPIAAPPIHERIRALERRAYELTDELKQLCREIPSSNDRRAIRSLANDMRRRMLDLEVLAA